MESSSQAKKTLLGSPFERPYANAVIHQTIPITKISQQMMSVQLLFMMGPFSYSAAPVIAYLSLTGGAWLAGATCWSAIFMEDLYFKLQII